MSEDVAIRRMERALGRFLAYDHPDPDPSRIYLAGPMTGIPGFNFDEFDRVAAYLRRETGAAVFNPADNENRETGLSRSVYMALDFSALLLADRIVFLEGWRRSQGAVAEAVVARELGLEAVEVEWHEPGAFDERLLERVVVLDEETLTIADPDGDLLDAAEPVLLPDEIAAEAIRLVYGDRHGDYGHPADDYGRTAALWSALLGVDISPREAALCMVLVKLSREMHSPKVDNMIDAHGYLLVADRILARERGLE